MAFYRAGLPPFADTISLQWLHFAVAWFHTADILPILLTLKTDNFGCISIFGLGKHVLMNQRNTRECKGVGYSSASQNGGPRKLSRKEREI